MRASPAFQVTVRRYGVWRAMVIALAVLASSALVAWLVSPDQSMPWAARLLIVSVLGVALLLAASLLRCAPMSLRWDSQAWHLGPEQSVGEEPWRGRLAVALDLGSWMLLRFAHESGSGRSRVTWLPVQRRGLEPQWHALRCAVYCAQPVDGHAAGPVGAASPESEE